MNAVARWVSILAHPFVMVTLLVAVPAMRQPRGHAAESIVLAAVVIVPVAVLMVRQVRRGQWSNVDASRPSERPLLFVVALAALTSALAWVFARDPTSYLVRGLLVMAAFLLLSAILTRWIKLSLHVAFVALTATALRLLRSWVGVALIPIVPVMVWSRLALARHHVHEVVAGLVLGVLTGVALVQL